MPPSPPLSARATAPAGEIAGEQTPAGAHVLIVEDDAIVGMFLTDLIEDLGYTPGGPATDPDAAYACAGRTRPDVAIVDISLRAQRDGLAVAAELKRLYDIPVIVMSGHGRIEDWPEVRSLEPAAILEKPCLPAQIERTLKAVITAEPN